jgi:outer membrane lipoprotein SlyB
MRKSLFAFALAGAVSVAGSASADIMEGTIARTDDSQQMVMLDTGEKLLVAKDIDTSKLDWGQPYEITMEMVDGRMTATFFEQIDKGESGN